MSGCRLCWRPCSPCGQQRAGHRAVGLVHGVIVQAHYIKRRRSRKRWCERLVAGLSGSQEVAGLADGQVDGQRWSPICASDDNATLVSRLSDEGELLLTLNTGVWARTVGRRHAQKRQGEQERRRGTAEEGGPQWRRPGTRKQEKRAGRARHGATPAAARVTEESRLSEEEAGRPDAERSPAEEEGSGGEDGHQ